MDVRVGPKRKLSTEELMVLNCGVGEDSLRVPWTARRSNRSILKEISPEYSLEGLMLKLKLQYFGHLMRRTDSLGKTLMLVKTEGRRGDDRGRDGWMATPTRWTWVWTSSRSWWWTGEPGMLQSMGLQRVGHNWATELTDWLYLQCKMCFIPVTDFITKSFYLWSLLPITLILLFYFPLATPSLFSVSMSLFLFCLLICLVF